MKQKALLFALVAGLGLASTSALAQEKRTILSLETAKKMAAACEQKAKAEGWKMNIAILDAGANLKYFLRQDDAFLGSVKIAQLKANTSASFPFSTKQVGEITSASPVSRSFPASSPSRAVCRSRPAAASISAVSGSAAARQSRTGSAPRPAWTQRRTTSSNPELR